MLQMLNGHSEPAAQAKPVWQGGRIRTKAVYLPAATAGMNFDENYRRFGWVYDMEHLRAFPVARPHLVGSLDDQLTPLQARLDAISMEWKLEWEGRPEREGFLEATTAFNQEADSLLAEGLPLRREIALALVPYLLAAIENPFDGLALDLSQPETLLALEPAEYLARGEQPLLDFLTSAEWLVEVAKECGIPFWTTPSTPTGGTA